MTNANKSKGSQFERDCRDYLKSQGLKFAERSYGAGRRDDIGDISGIRGIVIECKNAKTFSWTPWLLETESERENAEAEYGFIVAKRARLATSQALVVTTLEKAIPLFQRIDRDASTQ